MEGGNVNQEEVFNNLLVMLFNEILDAVPGTSASEKF